MSKRPTYTKPDKNQADIIAELQALGYDVDDVHNLPGLYDLVVSGKRWIWFEGGHAWVECSVRVELKSPQGSLTATERAFKAAQHHQYSYIVADSTEDILQWFNGQG